MIVPNKSNTETSNFLFKLIDCSIEEGKQARWLRYVIVGVWRLERKALPKSANVRSIGNCCNDDGRIANPGSNITGSYSLTMMTMEGKLGDATCPL